MVLSLRRGPTDWMFRSWVAEAYTTVKFELTNWNIGVSDDELLAELRRVAQFLGKSSVRYEELRSHSRYSSRLIERRFGSWNNALSAAGLEVTQRVNIPVIEFFENMEQVWRLLGRQPSRQEMVKPLSLISGGAYQKRFGGWRKALEAFVVFANEDQRTIPESSTTISSVSEPRFPDLRLRFRVMRRDCYRCQACGKSPATEAGVLLHIDHIIPWSKGGKTCEENLRTLCEKCNLGKSDLSDTELKP